ncbi:hypothetical protein [Pseudomonas sp. W5-01]|uniref:hypothetical protein n=1 Tax=Pseudomonas sp. W5-01 TaxID=3097454 RepID=UPI00397A9491
MKDPLVICEQYINKIQGLLGRLLDEIKGKSIARYDRENLNGVETNYKYYVQHAAQRDIESAVSSAKAIAIHAEGLGRGLSERTDSVEVLDLATQILTAASEFSKRIDTDAEFSLPYTLATGGADSYPVHEVLSTSEKAVIEMEAKLRSDIENFQRSIEKGYSDISDIRKKSSNESNNFSESLLNLTRDLETVRDYVDSIKKSVTEEINKAAKISDDAAKRSNDVDAQINDLLGQNASKVLLIDYANTAEKEGASADRMRGWSLVCMATSGLVVCIALYQTLSGELDWRQLLLKAFAALALSIPAAYLARESSRHRAQQHSNRRISLDLRAMTPYLASLPSDEQNKIKSEVASKIFGMQADGVAASSDNYPVNFQELAKLLIEKIPSKS